MLGYDALLGIVGKYSEVGSQDLALRVVLLGLRDWHRSFLSDLGIDFR